MYLKPEYMSLLYDYMSEFETFRTKKGSYYGFGSKSWGFLALGIFLVRGLRFSVSVIQLMLHKDFYILRDLYTGSGAHKVFYSIGTGVPSRG